MGYDIPDQLLDRVAVLRHVAHDRVVLVVHLVEAVERRMVHHPVDPHVQEIVRHHRKGDGLHQLPVRGELTEGKADPDSNDASIDVKREDDKLIDDDVLQGTPLHVVPVLLLPRLLQARLGLVLLVGLGSEVTRQVNEAEDEHGGSEGDADRDELERSLVLDVFGPN